MDVQVMRGANCWTDHQMVSAKVCVEFVHSRRNRGKRSVPLAVQHLNDEAKAVACCECLSQLLKERPHNPAKPSNWNWQTLKSCTIEATERTLSCARQKKPDWFLESTDILMPLLQMKNEAHERMLQNCYNSISNHKEFCRQQRMVQEAVQAAKENWILRLASKGEKAAKDGCTRWKVELYQEAAVGSCWTEINQA